jgi:hypothetical protein
VAEQPNSREGAVAERASEPGSAVVRPIASARRANPTPNGDVAANLTAIKRRFRDWPTNTPSVGAIADLLGVARSTGKAYRDRLLAEQGGDGADPDRAVDLA